MRKSRRGVAAAQSCLVLALVLTVTGSYAEDQMPLSEMLPNGRVEIEFLEFVVPERMAGLISRFQAGIQEHPQWFAAFTKRHLASGGGPLPYHENFGLSEDEFREVQSFDTSGTVQPRGVKKTIEITVVDGLAVLSTPGWDDLPGLDSVSFGLGSASLSAYGRELGVGRWGAKRTGGGIYGPWRGYTWEYVKGDPEKLLGGDLKSEWERIELDLVAPYDDAYTYFRVRRHGVHEGALRDEHILFRYKHPQAFGDD